MVSLNKYFCFCSSGLQRFESKDGRGFLKCRTETCTLFTPEEKYNELVEVFQTKVQEKFKPNKFPLCECGEVTSLWVSHSASNPGRPFFHCQETNTEEKCAFFLWGDQLTKAKRKRGKAKRATMTRKPTKRVKILESSDEEKQKTE